MPPSHDPARFHALLPLLALLAALHPDAFQALAAAVGLLTGLDQPR